MSMEDLTFEQAMQRLEEIVSLLEDGQSTAEREYGAV